MNSAVRTQPRDGLAAALAFAPRVFRAKWPGLIAAVIGLAGTAVGVMLTTRLYRSEAVLMYQRGIASDLEGESPRALGLRLQDAFSSRVRLENLIKKNRLYPRLVKKRGLVEAAEEMDTHVKVTLREGYTYRVSYDAEDRDQAREVLTQLIQSVIDEEDQRRRRQAEESKSFLDAERARADEEVKAKEAAVTAFFSRHPQLAGENNAVPGGTIRAADRAAAGPADTFTLEVQAANIEDAIAKAKAPHGPRSVVTKGGKVLDPVLVAAQTRASTELQAARRDLAAKEARFTNDHPDVKAAVIAVKQAEAAFQQAEAAALASATAIPSSTTSEAGPADDGASQTAGLQRALAAVRAQIAAVKARSAPRREVERDVKSAVAVDTEWAELTRAASEARERQQQLESRQFQAQLTATLVAAKQAGGLIVVDPPYRPMHPVTGGRSKVAIGGSIGSVVLALIVMVLAAMMDRRIYDMEDISRVIPQDMVIVVPRLEAPKGD